MNNPNSRKYEQISRENDAAKRQNSQINSIVKTGNNSGDCISGSCFNESIYNMSVEECESRFAEYCGVPHAIATKAAIPAIHSILQAADIGRGDEVIVPAFSSNIVLSTIAMCGAIPVIADVDPRRFTIDGEEADRKVSPKTKAIIGTDNFGQPFEAGVLRDLCADRDLLLIEDASQAIGASSGGHKAGSFGDIGFFLLPSGEGAMVTTHDDNLERQIRCRVAEEPDTDSTHLSMTVGFPWLDTVQEKIERRIKNAELYNTYLHLRGILTPYKSQRTFHVYDHYVVTVTPLFPMSRAELINHLNDRGFTATIPTPLPLLPIIDPEDCPVATLLSGCILSLPVHPETTDDQIKQFCDVLNKAEYT